MLKLLPVAISQLEKDIVSKEIIQGQLIVREGTRYSRHRTDPASLGGRFTGTPFQCGSGSVATVVLWDRYVVCELCDAPVQPTRCRSYRESRAVL